MLYVIAKSKTIAGDIYRLYDTDAGSLFSTSGEQLKMMVELNGLIIKNISIDGDQLVIKSWFNELKPYSPKEGDEVGSILLCRINNNRFKLIDSNEHIHYVDKEQLSNLVKENRVANCTFRGGKYLAVDYYKATENTQFETDIAKKYNRYEALSAMLIGTMTFTYDIEGSSVNIISYTGTAKRVIIPKFVTSIVGWAFVGSEMNELILEDGIKAIGSYAFAGCEISKITIPKTVEFMGMNVFHMNRKLLADNDEYREDIINILNKNAIVMDKIIKNSDN